MLTEDGLVAKAAAKGAGGLARRKNIDVVFSETYPKATKDFAPILMREFVAAYEKDFNRAPALQAANAYAGCQLFVEARAGSVVDSEKLREAC